MNKPIHIRVPSPRELEVLAEIAQGFSEKQISNRLYISEATVQTHKRSLFDKLDAVNSPSLIYKAVCIGFLPLKIA